MFRKSRKRKEPSLRNSIVAVNTGRLYPLDNMDEEEKIPGIGVIDKSIAKIIAQLNKTGHKTLASCSGTLADHKNRQESIPGYISFWDTPENRFLAVKIPNIGQYSLFISRQILLDARLKRRNPLRVLTCPCCKATHISSLFLKFYGTLQKGQNNYPCLREIFALY